VAIVILGYALCLSIGACIGFMLAGIFTNASDKKSDLRLILTCVGHGEPSARWVPALRA
jgi:hypothetical protein